MRRTTYVAASMLGAVLLAGCGPSNGTASAGAASDGGGSANIAGTGGALLASGGTAAGGAASTAGAGGSPSATAGASAAAGASATAGNAGTTAGGSPGVAGAAVDPFVTTPGGSISVASLYYTEGLPTLLINPSLPLVAGAQGPTCTSTRSGDCVISTCTTGDANAARLSAGVITVDSPANNIHVFTTPDANGEYTGTPGSTPFPGGNAFTLSSTGGDIPAFNLSMQFPLLLVMDGAPAAVGTTATILAPHAAPLTLTWERGAPGVWLVVESLNTGNVGAECYFDSQVGSGTVPAEVLSALTVGQSLLPLTAVAATVQVGPPLITAWVAGEVLTPDKMARAVIQVQ